MARIPEFGLVGRTLWRILWPIARVLAMVFPYRRVAYTPLPEGPVVLAINHLSHVDPPIAGLAVVRPTRFLALDELWGHAWILDAIFRTFGVIPLPRQGRHPIGALRAALRELEAGGVVGVYPEGRRVANWGDAELKRGAAWLAVRTGAPLVPVMLWGTQHVMPIDSWRLRRAPVSVAVGPPIEPATYTDADDPIGAMTEAWRDYVDDQISRVRDSAG